MFQTFIKKLCRYTLLLSLFFLGCTNLFAQNEQGKVYKILGISVEGNKSADAGTIISNSGLKVGDEIQVPGDQTMNAIRQLWALNIFSDVQVLIEKKLDNGVFLLIKVQEYPRFEKLVIEGNDEKSSDDIEKKSNFIRGQILKPQEIESFEQQVLKLYADDGYLNAKVHIERYDFFTADTTEDEIVVTWRNEKDLSDEYNVNYEKSEISYSDLISRIKERILLKLVVDEGEEVTVRKIEFTGNHAFEASDLKGAMDKTEESKWWKFWSSAQFHPDKYKDDKDLIVKFYQKNGYRDAEIISDSLIYYNDNKDLEILINLYEGPQYKVRNIVFSGNTVFNDDILRQRLDFAKGDVFDYDKFEKNLHGNEKQSDLSSLYLDNGYLTFNVQETEQKVPPDSMDISIRIDERSQFRIGKVDITGDDKTKDKVIRRELYTVPGDYFNRGLLLRSIQQLANLQYFNVEKLYGPEAIDYSLANDSTVNVVFNVEEKSSDYLNASVGYSGSFGFSGSVGVTLTNFSLAEPFRLGGGQVLSFNWQFGVGSLYRTFTLGFTEPWFMDTPTLVGAEVFDTRIAYGYDMRQSGGSLKLGRRLKWPDDFFYVEGLLKFQYNDVLNGQNYYPEGLSRQFTVGATISRKNIDNPVFPSIGSSLSLNGELSGGPLLPGDVDYYKLDFSAEWYKRLFNSNRIVIYTLADLGFLHELVQGTPVLPFEYYYMGGNGLVIATTPLRGYDDQTVGPRNSVGNVIGGRVMSRYTVELRFAVTLEPIPLYLLAFAEAGNVWKDINTTDPFDLRRSAGIGARILINPLGLIGFDLGYGFDRILVENKEPAWLFHFQFGKGF